MTHALRLLADAPPLPEDYLPHPIRKRDSVSRKRDSGSPHRGIALTGPQRSNAARALDACTERPAYVCRDSIYI